MELVERVHDSGGVQHGRTAREHQDVGDLEATPCAVVGMNGNASNADGGNRDWTVGGVDAEAGGAVSDAVEHGLVGDHPESGHRVDKGRHGAATGRRADGRWNGRCGHGRGGKHHTISEGAESGGVGLGSTKWFGLGRSGGGGGGMGLGGNLGGLGRRRRGGSTGWMGRRIGSTIGMGGIGRGGIESAGGRSGIGNISFEYGFGAIAKGITVNAAGALWAERGAVIGMAVAAIGLWLSAFTAVVSGASTTEARVR